MKHCDKTLISMLVITLATTRINSTLILLYLCYVTTGPFYNFGRSLAFKLVFTAKELAVR